MTPQPNSMYLITAEEYDEILNSLPPEKVVEILDCVRSRKVPEHGGAQAAIERERWYHRLNGILKTAKFYDQVDTMLQEVVKEMEEESTRPQPIEQPNHICIDCKVKKRLGPLPCHWKADIEIVAMKEGSPKFAIVECEHYGKIEVN